MSLDELIKKAEDAKPNYPRATASNPATPQQIDRFASRQFER